MAAYTSASRNALRSGIIVGGPRFTTGMSPDEIELANHLIMFRDQESRTVYSYNEIGTLYHVNGQTISRRHAALVDKFPTSRPSSTPSAPDAKKPNAPPPPKSGDDDKDDDLDADREE